MKLIHSGKILKNDQTVAACQIKANDFLVVMVSKAKKKKKVKHFPYGPTTLVSSSSPSSSSSSFSDGHD